VNNVAISKRDCFALGSQRQPVFINRACLSADTVAASNMNVQYKNKFVVERS
jgi:hypothetical protein